MNITIEEMKQQYEIKLEQIDTNYESKNKEIDKNTEEITKKINLVQINYDKQNNEMNQKIQTDLFSHFAILCMINKQDPKIYSLIQMNQRICKIFYLIFNNVSNDTHPAKVVMVKPVIIVLSVKKNFS